jgi:adenylate cyclase
MERERKFLVSKPPAGLTKFPHKRIRQGYLAVPGPRDAMPVEVRVRDEAGKHVLTVKGGRGESRSEIELPIPDKVFRSLWKLTRGKRIEKVRYRIPLGKLTVELDVYRGKLRGLITAEVEFKSSRQLHGFRPPPWLGRDITGRDEFSNSRLAISARPPTIRSR